MANFRNINTVPSNKELIDIVLNKTQRKTPTVIHPTYHISKIRVFYIKKVRFTTKEFVDRLSSITEQFPRLEDIHPFYSDLMNVLYDRDHFKMALGHINQTRSSIEKIGKEYVKLLKYSETLYRAKQLKRAALGRMATLAKKLGKSMEYLEEVRQHLSRLPSIDPSSLSLILCGYPNVGKSSFINKISRAHVDVQPYAFTTKNLFVGHFDFDYLRWQIIDTPGILDHPIEERNTIEMQTITALAHIQSTVLFLIDLSTSCGYSIEDQISLCESLEPLLGDFLVVLSKCDVYGNNLILDYEKKDVLLENLGQIDCLKNDKGTLDRVFNFLLKRKFVKISTETNENLEHSKKIACQILLKQRIEKKIDTEKINDVMNRIKIIKPVIEHFQEKEKLRTSKILLEKEKFENDRENYVFDEREGYLCDNKYDVVPEFFEGKNIADFIDPEIQNKLMRIEEEEEGKEAPRIYDIFTKEEREYRELIGVRKREREIIKNERGRAAIPKTWIDNRRKVEREIVIPQRNDITPVVINKGTFKKIKNQRYYDKKPKHIFRSSSKKGARGR